MDLSIIQVTGANEMLKPLLYIRLSRPYRSKHRISLSEKGCWLGYILYGSSTCKPLQMPLVDGVILNTSALFKGFIFAPDDSNSILTLAAIPVSSRPTREMTLSLLFTA